MWIPIKGYEGLYEVNIQGDVRRLPGVVERRNNFPITINGGMMKEAVGKIGYKIVTLSKENVKKTMYVHRLIATHFMEKDPDPKKTDVNHINGDKLDNRISNLEWITRGDNIRHAMRTGLHDKSFKIRKLTTLCRPHKISYEIAGEIRFMYETSGLSQKEVGKIYGVSQPLVGKIVRNEMWNFSLEDKAALLKEAY